MFKNKFIRHLTAAILVFVILTMVISAPVLAYSDFNFGSKDNTKFIQPFGKNSPSWIIDAEAEPWWKNIFDKKTGFDDWGSNGSSSGSKWW